MSAAVSASPQARTAHPAVRAWLSAHPESGLPRGVDVLKPRRLLGDADWERRVQQHRWSVFRLRGLLPGDRAVIAKYCARATGATEQLIYEQLFPEIGVAAPELLGVTIEDEQAQWLFLSDEGDVPWSPEGGDQQRRFTEWVAMLHARAARSPLLAQLPDRGARHYLGLLRGAREQISEAKRPDLRVVVDTLNRLEERWREVDAQSAALPTTLVHGDLVPKNIRLDTRHSRPSLVVLDWETAGAGPPAADLAQDWLAASSERRAQYRQRAHALRSTDADLIGVIRAGVVFRTVAAIAWQAESLAASWKIEKGVANLLTYACELGP